MLDGSQIAVVVPAYNERTRIANTLRSIPAYVDRVIVVDDGSRDGTSDAAAAVADERVDVVRHATNRGVGAALSTGYTRAFELGADVAVVMAGDGQMHPDDLRGLLAPLTTGLADYAKGDRLSHPEAFARMPLSRYLGNQVLSFLTRHATGLPLSDSQCGYTALHRRAHERMPMHALWRGYGYPNDLLGLLAREKLRVHDVVVQPIYAGEKSGVRLHHAVLVIPWLLLRVLARRLARVLREHASRSEPQAKPEAIAADR